MPVPGLALGYRVFRLPRQGYVLDECQDASAADPERGRFAVADGAAESPHSALSAQLLVEEFVRQSERVTPWADWLPSLQQRWAEHVGQPIGAPWYSNRGCPRRFATFLGFVVEETTWHALAVGDSCLFQVRKGALVRAFPIARAGDFGNAPGWSARAPRPPQVPHKNGVQQHGDSKPGIAFG